MCMEEQLYLEGSLENFLHQMNVTIARFILDGKDLRWRWRVRLAVLLDIAFNLALQLGE